MIRFKVNHNWTFFLMNLGDMRRVLGLSSISLTDLGDQANPPTRALVSDEYATEI